MNTQARIPAMLLLVLALALPARANTGHDNALAVTSSASQFDAPLITKESLSSGPTPLRAERVHGEYITDASADFWIYDSWVSFQSDRDADGYYSSFSITLDADTIYNAASVYAVIFVGRNDTYESIYTTSTFTLYGDESQDSLTIDSELVTGFPPREYQLLIELYDATTNQLVAYSDDYDDADLAYLNLESRNHDQAYQDTVVVVDKHGGSLSVGGLLTFGFTATLLILWRRRRTSNTKNKRRV